MQAKVKRCAKEITGDDTPRKLEPVVREKIQECAQAEMPAMDTDRILKESADQLRSAATSPEEKKEAEALIKKIHDEAQQGQSQSPAKEQPGKQQAGSR
mmetsp:Transcript_37844/g.59049  ORF Transcript_37844/g.59049 Transcript_37844/m.59049 type:complete len:99 (-) Transcript_37844:43-339(-)